MRDWSRERHLRAALDDLDAAGYLTGVGADYLAVARILGIDPEQAEIITDKWPLDWPDGPMLSYDAVQALLDAEGWTP